MQIEYLSPSIHFGEFAGLIFTSAHAIAAIPAPPLGMTAFCVGDRTAQAATARGLTAHSAGGSVHDLARLLNDKQRGHLLYLRGTHVAADLEGALGDDIQISSVVVYDQMPKTLNKTALLWLHDVNRVVFPLFSARSAALLLDQLEPDMAAPRIAICMSDNIAQICAGKFDQIDIAAAPTSTAMTQALDRHLRGYVA